MQEGRIDAVGKADAGMKELQKKAFEHHLATGDAGAYGAFAFNTLDDDGSKEAREKKKRENDKAWQRIMLQTQLQEMNASLARNEAEMDALLAEHLDAEEINKLNQIKDKDAKYAEADRMMREKLELGVITQKQYDAWYAKVVEREGWKAKIDDIENELSEEYGVEAKIEKAQEFIAEDLEKVGHQTNDHEVKRASEIVAEEKYDAGSDVAVNQATANTFLDFNRG